MKRAAAGLPRPFWVLWTGMLVNRAGSFVVPFLAIYLTQARGFSAAQAGIVAALYGAAPRSRARSAATSRTTPAAAGR